MELSRGVTIGPYRLLEQAGEGGMAEVWRAFDVRLERFVAVKFVAPRFARDPTYLDRFIREARAVSRLDHPNILTVHDFGEQEGWTYMVSPFIGGGTLAAQLRRGPWSVPDALAVLEPLASALDYAHAQGIVHRDVKPQNVLFTEQGRLILGDFGVTRIMEATTVLTQAGRIIGTPMYMAPEQAEGQPAGPASDQYSLGIIAYELLTGRPPFLAETPLAMLRAHIDRPLPPPRDLNPAISEAVQGALFRILAKAPADRYPSCGEFVAALRADVVSPVTPSYLPPLPGGFPTPPPALPPSALPSTPPSSPVPAPPMMQDPPGQAWPILTPPAAAPFYAPPPPPLGHAQPAGAVASERTARLPVSRRTALIGMAGALLLAGGGVGGVLLGLARDGSGTAASAATPTQGTAPPPTQLAAGRSTPQPTAALTMLPTPRPTTPPTSAPTPTLPPVTFNGAPMRTLMGHANIVMGIGFSPDGQILASGSHDQTVRLWRTADGLQLRSLQGHNQPIPSIAYAPDGQTIASVSWDRTVRVWRAADGAELLVLTGHTDNLVDVAYSWDSQLLASGGTDRTVRLWRVGDGTALQTISGHTGYVRAVAFSPANLVVASGAEDKTIRLWSVENGRQLRVIEGHTGYISKLAFTRNGQLLISVSDDKTIRIWRASDGSEVRVLEGHTATVRSLAISADGRMAATCGDDKTTRVWSIADGSTIGKVEGHTDAVMDVAFSPDGKLLATSSSDRTIRLWQV